jgi:hypothetical protein
MSFFGLPFGSTRQHRRATFLTMPLQMRMHSVGLDGPWQSLAGMWSMPVSKFLPPRLSSICAL